MRGRAEGFFGPFRVAEQRRLGLGGGCQIGFDAGGIEERRVEIGQSFRPAGAGEAFADHRAGLLDDVAHIVWQGVALLHQQMMGGGEAAKPGAGDCHIGGAAPAIPVWRVIRYLADRLGEGPKMAVQDFGQKRVQIGEMQPQGGRGHGEPGGQVPECQAVAAISGHMQGGMGHHPLMPLTLTGGELGRPPIEVFGIGTQDAGKNQHGYLC